MAVGAEHSMFGSESQAAHCTFMSGVRGPDQGDFHIAS